MIEVTLKFKLEMLPDENNEPIGITPDIERIPWALMVKRGFGPSLSKFGIADIVPGTRCLRTIEPKPAKAPKRKKAR